MMAHESYPSSLSPHDRSDYLDRLLTATGDIHRAAATDPDPDRFLNRAGDLLVHRLRPSRDSACCSGSSQVCLQLLAGDKDHGHLSVTVPAAYTDDPALAAHLQSIGQDIAWTLYRLRESERHRGVNDLLARSPVVAFVWKAAPGWPVAFVSQNVDRLFGWTAAQFMSGDIVYEHVIHPDDHDRVAQEVVRACADPGAKTVAHRPYRVVSADGEIRWVEDLTYIRRSADGMVQAYEGILLDITKRIEYQESLRRIKQAIDQSSDAVGMMAPDGHHHYQNETFTELFGYKLEELSSIHPRELHHDPAQAREIFESVLAGQNWSGETTVVTKSGQRVPVHLRASAVKNADGRIVDLIGVHTDITRQKEVEERLQKSREQYMLAVRGSNDGIWDWDLRNGSLFLSSRWKGMLGYAEDELPNAFSTFEDGLHPEDRPRALAAVKQYLEGETSEYDIEFRMRHKDGSYRWILARGQAVRNDQGVPVRMAGSHTDITEWKEAEASLRAQSSFVRSLLETAVTPVFYKDLRGVYVECNEAFARFLGKARAEILGATAFDLVPGAMARRYDEQDQALLAAGGEQTYQSKVLTQDGERDVVFHKAVCTDAASQPIGIVGVITDITEQERSRREVREKEQLVRSILASAPVGIMLIEPQEHRIILANEKACSMLGHASGGLQGTVCLDTICPRPDHRCPITDLGEQDDNSEGQLLTREGHTLPVLKSVTEISFGGRPHLLETFIDLTARKELEAQALQGKKLVAIGQLAAGIAHEINTPAQFVSDNTRFLQETFHEFADLVGAYAKLRDAVAAEHPEDPFLQAVKTREEDMDVDFVLEEVPTAIEQSLEGIQRITDIVAAMKEFSHPGGTEMSPGDINAAIRSTATVSRNEWKYVADMELDLDEDLPLVPCILGELNQAMLNMVVNAAQAIGEQNAQQSESRGKITITTRTGDGYAEIRIADNGPGIPEKLRERVFEPFFTTKKVGRGTGQGLSIARNVVVEKHGGTLEVESAPSAGTCFTIRLPLQTPQAGASSALDQSA